MGAALFISGFLTPFPGKFRRRNYRMLQDCVNLEEMAIKNCCP